MAIVISCTCGKKLRVGDNQAGRKILCPGCDRSLRVPNDSEDDDRDDRVRADRPGPKKAPRHDREDDDEPDVRAPRRGKKGRQQRSAVPLILAGVAALLLVGGGGFAGYWFFLRGESTSESAFLAPDAQGIVTFRIADIAKVDAFQKLMRAQGQGESLNEAFAKLGLAAGDVERLTGVAHDVEQEIGWAVLVTSKPYDRKAVLAKFENAASYKHEGKTFHVGKVAGGGFTRTPAMPGGMGPMGAGGGARPMGPGGKSGGSATQQAVFFAGPQLLVLANNEASIKKAITSALRPSPTGPLADAVKQVAGPKHVSFAFQLPAATQEKMKGAVAMMGAQAKVAAPLLQFTAGTGSIHVDANVVVDVALKYTDEGRAKAAMNSFTALKGLAEVFLLPMVPDPKMGEQIKAALASLNAEPRGAELAMKFQVPTTVLDGMVPGGPGMPGR